MLHDSFTDKYNGVSKISFSNNIRRCLDRSRRHKALLYRPTWSDLAAPLEMARKGLTLASDEAIRLVMAANPDTVRLVHARGAKGEAQLPGIIALLPLRAEGVEALLTGRLSGLQPDPDFIARPGELPTAIYIWLISVPGLLARTLTAFAEAFDSFLAEPVPIFSRGVHSQSHRLHRRAGFIPAVQVYPQCTADLQVILPERKAALGPALNPVTAASKPTVTVARTVEDIFKVFSVRSATYLAEQFCLYEEEFDGNDFCATHWLGTIDGDAAGCIRARFFGDFAKIERLAVRAEYRKSRLAFQLVRTAIDHCSRKGYRTLFGHSRLDLQPFWKIFGFQPVAGRGPLQFANIQYVEMQLDLPERPDRITLSEAPLRLLRPEGSWDQPGPFERPPCARHQDRVDLIKAHTRTVGNTKIIS